MTVAARLNIDREHQGPLEDGPLAVLLEGPEDQRVRRISRDAGAQYDVPAALHTDVEPVEHFGCDEDVRIRHSMCCAPKRMKFATRVCRANPISAQPGRTSTRTASPMRFWSSTAAAHPGNRCMAPGDVKNSAISRIVRSCVAGRLSSPSSVIS